MLSLLLAFALITDNDPNQQEYDRRQMDITLIVVNSFAFILLILSLGGLIPCVRNRIDKRAERIARSKVIPTDGGGGGDGDSIPSDTSRNWTMSNDKKPAENSTQKIPPPPAEKRLAKLSVSSRRPTFNKHVITHLVSTHAVNQTKKIHNESMQRKKKRIEKKKMQSKERLNRRLKERKRVGVSPAVAQC